jgi:hypothetical protein
MMVNVLKEAKSEGAIVLADGKAYKIPPITLNTLANIEDEMGCGVDKLQEQLNTKMATALRKFLYGLLKEGYPELTVEKVGNLVSMDIMQDVVTQVGKVMSK